MTQIGNTLQLQKKIEMIFIYCESRQNINKTVNLYALQYSRRYLLHGSFCYVVKQSSQDGSV